ncbi:restriction endonuclease subunit S [Alkalithermobacter paradoxus]|uniref:EcoKI restriction-modification system protein HsdS n=1 Tax=Alkalithermobacter paradoxus TaxID=29349 RepID=A0A1V4I4C7_9FIRM|nr:EcoKI restriction-modification system protein HsdS [[Clostridium] thermoalcaliphilum]
MSKQIREGYKMTELGEIPVEWQVEQIGNIFNFSGGLSIPRSQLSEEGIFYLHYGDIHKRNFTYINVEKDDEWLPKIDIKETNIKEGVFLETGDVVFADASEDYEGIGKSVVIINEKQKPFVSGLHTIVAKDASNRLNYLYKKYCFSTNKVRKQFRVLATGATVYGISRSNIPKIKILIPTITEQKKIASILTTIDEHIEQVDGLIEKTKELKRGLMQKLLTQGIGNTEFKMTEIGKIPKVWKIEKLNNVTDVRDGTHDSPKQLEEGIPFVTSKNLKEFGIDFQDITYISKEDHENISKRSKVDNGDILFAMIGTIGNPVIVNTDFEFSIKNVALIKFENSNMNNIFIKNLLESEVIKKQFDKKSNGGVQKFISLGMIRNLEIPCPSLEEQQKIAFILSEVDQQIEQYNIRKEKLITLKKGLMQQILTGKKRVIV